MNPYRMRWNLIAAVIGIVLLAGCSLNKGKTEAKTPAAESEAMPEAAAPGGEGEHGETAEAVTPAGTVAEIWTQIEGEQGKLSAAIENGQLKDVHRFAFGIRDLVVALADKVNMASPAGAPKLQNVVEQVKESASKLDEMGDAGNLSGTQAEAAKLNAMLSAIKAAASAK